MNTEHIFNTKSSFQLRVEIDLIKEILRKSKHITRRYLIFTQDKLKSQLAQNKQCGKAEQILHSYPSTDAAIDENTNEYLENDVLQAMDEYANQFCQPQFIKLAEELIKTNRSVFLNLELTKEEKKHILYTLNYSTNMLE